MNQIKAGAVLNYVIIGLNILLGLLYTPYMLRMLGQNEYGLYSLVASVIAYLTLLDFGFGNAVVRYTAKFQAKGQKKEQWEMFGMVLVIYTIIGLVAFCVGLGIYFNVDRLFDNVMSASDISQARIMIMFLLINLALTFPLSMFGSIITAYEDFLFQKGLNIARMLLSTGVIILLLHYGYKAIAMVVVQTVFNIGTLLINALYCHFKLKIKIYFKHFNKAFLKEISIYSFWLFLNAIMDRVYWSTGQFVIGAMIGTTAVAVFSVAILFQQMYMSFSTAISNVLLPRVTAMVAKEKTHKEISDLFISTGRAQFAIISLITCGFIVFGRPFVIMWAGEDYAQSYILTLMFFASLLIPLIQNTGIIILQARNEMRFRSVLYVCIAVASLVLQVWWTNVWGVIGCCSAISIALVLGQGIIMNIYYKVKQHIDVYGFWREIGRMAIVPLVLIVVGLFCIYCIEIDTWWRLCAAVAVFAVVYALLFYRYSMNGYERDLVKKFVSKLGMSKYRI